MTHDLPIPPEKIFGPIDPVLANYLLWRIKQEIKAPDADEFGRKLLAYFDEVEAS